MSKNDALMFFKVGKLGPKFNALWNFFFQSAYLFSKSVATMLT